jgi:hypothetical protein
MKFDSLTVLDYIKTSIEILMQMKLEEDKLNLDGTDKNKALRKKPSATSNMDQLNETPMSSTMKSLDLPPKEYE